MLAVLLSLSQAFEAQLEQRNDCADYGTTRRTANFDCTQTV